VVQLIRRGQTVIGRGNAFLKHFMEVRGVGVVDVREMFGIRAIRVQKRIEVEVRLELWERGKHYDRVGLEYDTSPILGLPIPQVILPIVPGKNVTVIAETIAMNHMLKVYGRSWKTSPARTRRASSTTSSTTRSEESGLTCPAARRKLGLPSAALECA
jgi:HPr kinase/phosphorylase